MYEIPPPSRVTLFTAQGESLSMNENADLEKTIQFIRAQDKRSSVFIGALTPVF